MNSQDKFIKIQSILEDHIKGYEYKEDGKKKKKKNKIRAQIICKELKKNDKGELELVNIGIKSYFSRLCSPITVTALQETGSDKFLTPQHWDVCVGSLERCCWSKKEYKHKFAEVNISKNLAENMITGEIKDQNLLELAISGLLSKKGVDNYVNTEINYNGMIAKRRIGLKKRTLEMVKKDISKGGYSYKHNERISFYKWVKLVNPDAPIIEITVKKDPSTSISSRYENRNDIVGCGYVDQGDIILQNLYICDWLAADTILEFRCKDHTITDYIKIKVTITSESSEDNAVKEYVLMNMKVPPINQTAERPTQIHPHSFNTSANASFYNTPITHSITRPITHPNSITNTIRNPTTNDPIYANPTNTNIDNTYTLPHFPADIVLSPTPPTYSDSNYSYSFNYSGSCTGGGCSNGSSSCCNNSMYTPPTLITPYITNTSPTTSMQITRMTMSPTPIQSPNTYSYSDSNYSSFNYNDTCSLLGSNSNSYSVYTPSTYIPNISSSPATPMATSPITPMTISPESGYPSTSNTDNTNNDPLPVYPFGTPEIPPYTFTQSPYTFTQSPYPLITTTNTFIHMPFFGNDQEIPPINNNTQRTRNTVFINNNMNNTTTQNQKKRCLSISNINNSDNSPTKKRKTISETQ
eukprot:84579_1